jgi:subtilisin family serine protease
VPKDAEAVRVAIIDSGVDADHQAFAGVPTSGQSFIGGRWDDDTHGHGTGMASAIAGNGSAEGVCPLGLCELLVAQIYSATVPIRTSVVAEAIDWAISNDADVINLSLTLDNDTRVAAAIAEAPPRGPGPSPERATPGGHVPVAGHDGVIDVRDPAGNCEVVEDRDVRLASEGPAEQP